MPSEYFFQLYYGENMFHFYEMKFALNLTNTLSWIFIGQANWNNSP